MCARSMACRVTRRCAWPRRSRARAVIRSRAPSPPRIPTSMPPPSTTWRRTLALGVSATIEGRALRLGRSDFALAGKPLARELRGRRAAGRRRGPIAAFRMTERLRPDACAAIEALQAQGMTVLIASGDATAEGRRALPRDLNVGTWRARLLAGGKAGLAGGTARGGRARARGRRRCQRCARCWPAPMSRSRWRKARN